MKKKVIIIDTSVLCVWLQLPGKETAGKDNSITYELVENYIKEETGKGATLVLPLTSIIEKLTDIGSRTYLAADSYLISLEETLTPEMIEKLSALNPLPIKFVFRDSAFDDDIAFKDETFRKLNALIDKNTSEEKKTYTVEFI